MIFSRCQKDRRACASIVQAPVIHKAFIECFKVVQAPNKAAAHDIIRDMMSALLYTSRYASNGCFCIWQIEKYKGDVVALRLPLWNGARLAASCQSCFNTKIFASIHEFCNLSQHELARLDGLAF